MLRRRACWPLERAGPVNALDVERVWSDLDWCGDGEALSVEVDEAGDKVGEAARAGAAGAAADLTLLTAGRRMSSMMRTARRLLIRLYEELVDPDARIFLG